ncbi:Hypothetical predicted protein [Mytilus galloprovincialis]|uniref:Uncharacterized protein n=1 Tax=Mytilus galloprovincialis TaxID=29158 RepID=A0A8B6EEX8_MYTGA|nr:Hypothetical predicted protein [Mytilus galloprovincialis]
MVKQNGDFREGTVYIKLQVRSLERSSCSLKFVKCNRDETIGVMLSKELPEDVGISRIITNEADVEPDMPVNVLEEFGPDTGV